MGNNVWIVLKGASGINLTDKPGFRLRLKKALHVGRVVCQSDRAGVCYTEPAWPTTGSVSFGTGLPA